MANVSFGKYEANEQNSVSPGKDYTLNVFFDGTQNNKSNTQSRLNKGTLGKVPYDKHSNKKDDSYENDYSNVAREYDAIDTNQPLTTTIYVEGIGTVNHKSDQIFPVGLGHGSFLFAKTGVKDKVNSGCENAAKEIAKRITKINVLTVNVFGFSRGATAARHFIEVSSKDVPVKIYSDPNGKRSWYYLPNRFDVKNIPPTKMKQFILKNGYLGQCLFENEVEFSKVVFNFVGLYDTVSSYGMYHGNDVWELGLDAIKNAKMTLQIGADNEYRENFDLTNINSSGIKGIQFKIPGVHCDIGGAYIQGAEETSIVNIDNVFSTLSENNCDKFKKILIEEGWYNEKQLVKKTKAGGRGRKSKVSLQGKRVLHNTYDKISLNKMISFSKNYDIKYNDKIIKDKYEIKDTFLINVNKQLENYMSACNDLRNSYVVGFNKANSDGQAKISKNYNEKLKEINYLDFISSENLKKLRNEYLHWSVKCDKFGLGPRFSGPLPESKRKREIQNG